MYKVTITTEYSFSPIRVCAVSYKFKCNFLSLTLKDNKKIVYNINRLEKIEVEEVEDDLDCTTE